MNNQLKASFYDNSDTDIVLYTLYLINKVLKGGQYLE